MKNTLCLLLLFAALPAAADSNGVFSEFEAPSADYADGSVSVVGSASFSVGLLGPSPAGTGLQSFALASGLAVRVVTKRGFTFEPRLALGGSLITGSAGLFAVFAAGGGVGAGWAFALSPRLALTPMLSYELLFTGGGVSSLASGLSHTGSIELPLTVFFSKTSFVELYVRGGATYAVGQLMPAFAAGYRFGVRW